MHAYSPKAPAKSIHCFEFSKYERTGTDYRFFLASGRTVVVTKYKFRGIVIYEPTIRPSHPLFEETLNKMENTAEQVPSTQHFLNARILKKRTQLVAYEKEQEAMAKAPRVTLVGRDYVSPEFDKIVDGALRLTHANGASKIPLKLLNADDLERFQEIDPKVAVVKVVTLNGKRLWNPGYAGLRNGVLKVDHAEGTLSIPYADLQEDDREIVQSWSDGSWKIAEAGLYGFDKNKSRYDELVLGDGKCYQDVSLEGRKGEQIRANASGKNLFMFVGEIAGLPGLSSEDTAKLDDWVEEILSERFAGAKPQDQRKVIAEADAENGDLLVTNVRARILQVLDDGVLASEFVGTLHKGNMRVKTTSSATVKHPVTDKNVTRVVDEAISTIPVTERVRDDLCYIVGDTSKLTEGE